MPELKVEQDQMVKLQAFDSSYFRGKSLFKNDGTQSYLVFQPIFTYFTVLMLIIIKCGNLKDCLMKLLNHLLHLVTVFLHH